MPMDGLTPLQTIGFVGLGHMGHGMATNLLKAGFSLRVMAHRRRQAVEDLVMQGAIEVNSAAEMARQCDAIVLCVSGAEQVRDIVERADGFAASAKAGLIVIDCTTSPPQNIIELQWAHADMVFVDAPLGRSPREAWDGKLSVMVGAQLRAFDTIHPVLASFASTIQHVGGLGAGHTLKLVNNYVSMGYAAIYAGAVTLAVKGGLSVAQFDDLIKSSRMDCAFFGTFMGWLRDGDASSHNFSLENAAHTIGDIGSLSHSLGTNDALIDAIATVFEGAVSAGMGRDNLPELPRWTARRAGIALSPINS